MKKLLVVLAWLVSADVVAQDTELKFPLHTGNPYTCDGTTEGFGYMDSTAHTPFVCNATAWTSLFSTITGSGTTNKLAKWTSASALGNSNFTDSTSGVNTAIFAPTTFSIGGYAVSPTPSFGTLSAPSATAGDTDVTGGTLFVTSGTSTGSGTAGLIRLQVSPNSTTGSTLNTLTNVAQFGQTAFAIGGTTINSGGSAPTSSSLQGYNAAGTDVAGGPLTISNGRGTGSAAASQLTLQVVPNSTTGTSLNAAKNVFAATGTLFNLGNVTINSGGAAPASSTIQGYNAAGTDIAGGGLLLNGGTSTGTGAGGTIQGSLAPNSTTGSSVNAVKTAFSFQTNQWIIGGWAINSGGTAPASPSGTIQGVNQAGADKGGTFVSINPGVGTGSGTSGTVRIQVDPNAGTSSTLHTLVSAAAFSGTSTTIGGFVTNSGGTAPAQSTWRGVDAAGTDIAGGALVIGTGKGTGASTAPTLSLQVAPNQATGTGLNPNVTAASFTGTGYTIGTWDTVSGGTAPSLSTIRGVDAVGTDIAGGNLTTGTGQGTGSATAPNYVIQVAPNAGTGTSQNTLKTFLIANGTSFVLGNVTMNSGGAAITNSTIQGYNAAGTDVASGGVVINGGQSTGTGAGGEVKISVAPPDVTGSSANALQQAMDFGVASGNFKYVIGGYAARSGALQPQNPSALISGLKGTGADIAGTILSLNPGLGTGAGAAGSVQINAAPNSGTGTTQHAATATGLLIDGTHFTLGGVQTISGGTAATASTIQGYLAAGTDIAGGAVSLNGGQSTGTGAGGAVTIKLSPNAATGSSANALATAATFNGTSVTVGDYAINSGGTAPAASIHGGVSAAGTDIAGGSVTLKPGTGTGAGAGAQANINRDIVKATGSTAQSSVNGFTVCETKILSNTSATTTTLATIGLASNTGGGAIVGITVVADDGTNFDSETQQATLSFVNKAGTFTISTPTITASSAASNSGSTTIGFTATGASSLISLKVTPVFATIVPTTVMAYIEVANHSAGAVACQ